MYFVKGILSSDRTTVSVYFSVTLAMELRSQRRSSYRELIRCKVPRISRPSNKKYDPQKLYSVKIIETRDNRVKVHYVGYSSKYDEWKDKSEIECCRSEQIEHHDQVAATKVYVSSLRTDSVSFVHKACVLYY